MLPVTGFPSLVFLLVFSFYAAKPFFGYFNSRNVTGDHLYAGISVEAYYLLLVCLLSFGQWYLTGWLIDHLILVLSRRFQFR